MTGITLVSLNTYLYKKKVLFQQNDFYDQFSIEVYLMQVFSFSSLNCIIFKKQIHMLKLVIKAAMRSITIKSSIN